MKKTELSDSTRITAKQFRTNFRLPYPLFSEQVTLLNAPHPLTSNVSRKKHKNCTVCSIRRTIRREALHNSVRKRTDRKPAFSILVSDCIRVGLTPALLRRQTGSEVDQPSLVPFLGQSTQIPSSLPPKRDCSPERDLVCAIFCVLPGTWAE